MIIITYTIFLYRQSQYSPKTLVTKHIVANHGCKNTFYVVAPVTPDFFLFNFNWMYQNDTLMFKQNPYIHKIENIMNCCDSINPKKMQTSHHGLMFNSSKDFVFSISITTIQKFN